MNGMSGTTRGWIGPGTFDAPAGRITAWIAAVVLATALAAQVAVPVPLTAVPMTLQMLVVLLAGSLLGPYVGSAGVAAYVALGAAGAPVFSTGGAGLPWLLGPTGGYLLAMPLAAFVVGAVAGSERAPLRLFAGLVLGTLTVYVGGAAQLSLMGGGDLVHAVAVGVVPFLLGDLIKVLIAFALTGAVQAHRSNARPGQ